MNPLKASPVGHDPRSRTASASALGKGVLLLAAALAPMLLTVSPERPRDAATGVRIAGLTLQAGPSAAQALFVRRAWRRFRRGVSDGWRRVSDAARRHYRHLKEQARSTLDTVLNTARDLVGRAGRIAGDAADLARRKAAEAQRRAAELAERTRRAMKDAIDRARAIADRVRGGIAAAIDAARRAAEAAAKAARDAMGKVRGFFEDVVGGEITLKVWQNPDVSCRFKLRSPASSVGECVKKIATRVLEALPWIKEPVRLVAQIKDKVQGYAVNLFSCVKKMGLSGVKEAGRIVSNLVRDPLSTVKGFFTGALDLLAREAGPLMKMFDPRRLLAEVMSLLPKTQDPPKKKVARTRESKLSVRVGNKLVPAVRVGGKLVPAARVGGKLVPGKLVGGKIVPDPANTSESAPNAEEEPAEETDLAGATSAQPSAMSILSMVAGPIADKAVKFADTMPDEIWKTLERWKKNLEQKGISAPFACLPLVKKAFNEFKTPIMRVVKAVVAKTKDIVTLISPVMDKIINQILEIGVGILGGTKLFQSIRKAVTVVFVDSAGAINKKIERVKALLTGVAADPEAEMKQMAKDVIAAIPFLKLTFWVQVIKDPIKDKITEKLIALGNEAIDWVMSTIRAELFNLLNRLIDWASETIPYASYVLSDLGPVIMWIVRIAWDKVIDPIVRAVAQKVLSTVVTYSVDLAVEFAAAVIREGTTRLDKLISNGIGSAIDKIPVPGPLKGIIMVVLKIYKDYVEPQINVMQFHLNSLGGFMNLLAGVVPPNPDEKDDDGGGDDGGGDDGGGEAGGEAGGGEAGGGKAGVTARGTVGGKLGGALTRKSADPGKRAPRATNRTGGAAPAPSNAAAPSASPAALRAAFSGAYRAVAKDRIAALVSLRSLGAKAPPTARAAALAAISKLSVAVQQVFRLVHGARSRLGRALKTPNPAAAAALAASAAAPPVATGLAASIGPVFARLGDVARRFVTAAGKVSPQAAAFAARLEQALSAGDAALKTLSTLGGAR